MSGDDLPKIGAPAASATTEGRSQSGENVANVKGVRTALVVIALVALLVTAGLGLKWRASYQPLSVESEAVASGNRLVSGIEHPGGAIMGVGVYGLEALAPDPDDVDALRAEAPYRDGAHVTFGVAIHNAGRVGVTITGFDLPSAEQFVLLAVAEVRVGKRLANGRSSVVHTFPFHAFTLRPGETRDVVIRQTMHACESNAPGTGNVFAELGVRYRVLGLNRHADLATPVHIVVTSPPTAECPRPAKT